MGLKSPKISPTHTFFRHLLSQRHMHMKKRLFVTGRSGDHAHGVQMMAAPSPPQPSHHKTAWLQDTWLSWQTDLSVDEFPITGPRHWVIMYKISIFHCLCLGKCLHLLFPDGIGLAWQLNCSDFNFEIMLIHLASLVWIAIAFGFKIAVDFITNRLSCDETREQLLLVALKRQRGRWKSLTDAKETSVDDEERLFNKKNRWHCIIQRITKSSIEGFSQRTACFCFTTDSLWQEFKGATYETYLIRHQKNRFSYARELVV